MTKIRTIAPTVLAITLDQAKASLRVDDDSMDAQITLWARGVIAATEHATGQCLMRQTWGVNLNAFPGVSHWRLGDECPGRVSMAISLPHPVISIESITYLDADGAEQTLEPAAYRIKRERYQSSVAPVAGSSWPATAPETDAVTVTVVCGYGDDPAAVPENIQLYIAAKLAEQFDPATRTERDTVQSTYLDGLLDACRCFV